MKKQLPQVQFNFETFAKIFVEVSNVKEITHVLRFFDQGDTRI